MNKRSSDLLHRGGRGGGHAAAGLGFAGLLLLAGCDNVEWGGVQVGVREPAIERPDSIATAPADTAAEAPLQLPVGPLLFHVRRVDDVGRAIIEPVGELSGGQLVAVGPQRADRSDEYVSEFVARYFRPDRPYTLFRGEARVGTFYVGAAAVVGSGLCLDLRAQGRVELRPFADTLSEFLAWPPGARVGSDSLAAPRTRNDMSSLSQVLVRRSVLDSGLPGTFRVRAPADLRALDVGEGQYGFAASFLTGDTLGPGAPPDSAGAAFLVADYSSTSGFFPVFFDADWYGPGQKRALRWVDAADVLGDGRREWVLQAYGDVGSWYELVAERDTTRSVVWSSRRPVCEARVGR
ncbi:MAG TPA: hypothetical protein VLC48_07995 [Gemmatimonadota bacterium]|nr:hypothetical protein [Gemmatimonadota bacterium]